MAKNETKMPKQELEAEIVGLGPAVTAKVTPDDGKVSIGDKTWTVNAKTDVFQGKKGPKVILVESQGKALPVWGKDEDAPTSTEVDTLAYNNLLIQLNNLSKGGEKKPSNVGVYIALAVVALVVIGATINVNGNIKDIDSRLTALSEPPAGAGGPEDDSTAVNSGGGCLRGAANCPGG